MSYISELQVDNGAVVPIGSRLYGICNSAASTPAKVITLNNFDYLINGITIHVKFTYGNTAVLNNYFTLAVGSTEAKRVYNPGGRTDWSAGAIISFTYDSTDAAWIVNDSDSIPPSDSINVVNTYNANSTDAISGQGVADALDDLGSAAQKGVVTSIVETGAGANKNSTDLPTTNAITSYVDSKTAGLTGAMHFVGELSALPYATNITTYNTYEAGDVVLIGDKEYVYSKGADAENSAWILLGDEGSYALKTNTASVVKTATFTANTLPQLTVTPVSIPNVTAAGVAPTLSTNNVTIPNVTNAGSAANFEVTAGVLKITKGTAPTLGNAITVKEVDDWDAGSATTLGTEISVGSASGWNAGSQANLSTDAQTVVVP